ncbi:hypothetical protein A3A09_02940 [Candidatus Nomurabacteria bacterium RIFCSPLOWO2_01_FULL_42_20]|uniref:SsuA/THI5-like domain-containing protein n=1 Tax=Candidatus Nomurabacteria bacterium RIFCSPHIGHO2_01_FULL_42_16 TaxID=1801743 RepID=A0A1F6VJD6_9BACT|nr:MAG: hypothetical protein A2824_03045 [Candidatus Nomurabacteria bacterium RIFCSPHIGHO2_01_FULL_42_16]OGI92563.1 MAG: hypothetical protein A3A09_02940 [Candidatus Nomurabacteria bacterium RIFCSPLOWO2_01_FULL_42_20]
MQEIHKKKLISLSIILILFVLGFLFFLYTGLSKAEDLPPSKKVVIGYVDWPGYVGLFIAHNLGFFREAGLEVDLQKYDSLKNLSVDYSAGKLDGRTNLTLDAIHEAYDGVRHKIVAVINYSLGADMIIGRKNIKSIKDLKGKKVAYDAKALEEFFLNQALDEYGLKLKDVQSVLVPVGERTELIKAGIVDAVVTYEPHASKILDSSAYRVIYSSADAPGFIVDVWTFKTEFIKEHEETVRLFLEAYFRGVDFYKKNQKEGEMILAKQFDIKMEEATAGLLGVHILDSAENKTAFTFASKIESIFGNLRIVNKFLLSNHIDDHIRHEDKDLSAIDTDYLIDRRFLR